MKQPSAFTTMPIKDFAKKLICDGHLYLKSKEGRRFYVLKPGIYVDPSFIKKYASTNTIFDYQQVTNPEVVSKFGAFFKELRYLQFEKDMRLKSTEILAYFQSVYSSDEHFLSFALACFEEFCSLPQEALLKFHDTDIHLFRKAMYAGAFAVITALANDFYHYPMLKDFYHLTLCLDIGVCEAHYSYFVAEACNRESKVPGSGRLWMESEKATDIEKRIFFQHPLKGHAFIKSLGILSFPELAEVMLYQHELANGSGFPRGIPKALISSWEAVIIFADSLVEIKDDYEFENQVCDYILNFHNQKLSELPVQRTFKKLCLALDHVEKLKRTGS